MRRRVWLGHLTALEANRSGRCRPPFGPFGFQPKVSFLEGVTREFSVAVPFIAVPTNFVSDKVPQVAAEVKARVPRELGKPGTPFHKRSSEVASTS